MSTPALPAPTYCPYCGADVGKWGHDDSCARPPNVTLTTANLEELAGRPTQRELFDECLDAGWDPTATNTFGDEIAHLHAEVSEAFEAYRLHRHCRDWTDSDGKPHGVPIEFADVLIGMFYLAELHGFDLWEAVRTKHEYNLTRDYVREGRQLHE